MILSKTCIKCNKLKPSDQFRFRQRNGQKPEQICKSCLSKEHSRKSYKKNKQGYQKRRKAYNAKLKAIINKAKDRPCEDCGIRYDPWIMQFDHLPGTEKKFTIGRMKCSPENTKAEIEKCDVVCANCHADRTYKRMKGILV